MQTIGKLLIKDDAIFLIPRSTPAWWRQGGESGTKQLYQPELKLVTYVVPTTSILGRLLLIPVGDHSTIPAVFRHCKKELFKLGRSDEDGHLVCT